MIMNSLRILVRNNNQCFKTGYHQLSVKSLSSDTRYQRAAPKPSSESSEDETINVVPGNKRGGAVTDNKPVVGILGGGISGLSAAYYLAKNYGDHVQPVVFEKSDRVGGWVNTVTTDGGTRFEMGPRTIRPAGISGLNTLDLIEELGLEQDVMFIQRDHPTAKNRYIFVHGKLVKLPSDAKVLYKKMEPFSKPLMFSVLKDIFARRKTAKDDSIHEFVSRRFGREVADYLIDPVIRGICGGDSKSVSVKFLLKELFELEQNHGSVVLGQVARKLFSKQKCKLSLEEKAIGFSKISVSSLHGNWAVWSLEQGLGHLPVKLEEYLNAKKVQIRKNTNIKSIQVNDSGSVNVKFYTHNDLKRSDLLTCDHLISTLPGMQLSTVMKSSEGFQNSELTDLVRSIKGVDLQVTGLTYDHDIINEDAFGFLVPSMEKSVEGLLGIVFDTCSFPQGDKTIITVMSRSNDGSVENIDKIKWYVEKTLGVKSPPVEHRTEMLRNCIPQYHVGHYDKVDRVREIINESRLPVTLAGATWDGVSVNDCIYSGRKAAVEVGRRISKISELNKKMYA